MQFYDLKQKYMSVVVIYFIPFIHEHPVYRRIGGQKDSQNTRWWFSNKGHLIITFVSSGLFPSGPVREDRIDALAVRS